MKGAWSVGQNAAADITKLEACDCASRERVEGFHQSEYCDEASVL